MSAEPDGPDTDLGGGYRFGRGVLIWAGTEWGRRLDGDGGRVYRRERARHACYVHYRRQVPRTALRRPEQRPYFCLERVVKRPGNADGEESQSRRSKLEVLKGGVEVEGVLAAGLETEALEAGESEGAG
eukprot:3778737-Rhodomonas_salina.3